MLQSDCWIFDVQLLTYNNPTSRRSSTLCCDSGCGDCDNDFDFCLRGTGSSNCIYGSYRTGLVAENDDSLTFGDIIGINSISNPLIFNGTEPPSDVSCVYIVYTVRVVSESIGSTITSNCNI